MAKDPAFLFYPADASEDTQFMNRLERGCYFDILKAQKKFRRFTLPLIQKVLGGDFNACWPALETVLEKEGEVYFIGWANNAIENRAIHAAKQKKRIQDYWDKKKQESTEDEPDSFQSDTTEQPDLIQTHTLVIENANAIENDLIKKESSTFEQTFIEAFDDATCDRFKMTFRGLDLESELQQFRTKCDNDPNEYHSRDAPGLRKAFQYQLKNSKPIKNANQSNNFGKKGVTAEGTRDRLNRYTN